MTISAAKITQKDAIAILINKAYRGNVGWTLEYHLVSGERIDSQGISALIKNPSGHLFVCSDKEQLLGTICIEEKEGEVYFGLFAVEPNKQNLGIGKKLLHFAERFVKETLQHPNVKILVISIREEILAYYERRGYRVIQKDIPFPKAYVPYLKRKDIRMVLLEKSL